MALHFSRRNGIAFVANTYCWGAWSAVLEEDVRPVLGEEGGGGGNIYLLFNDVFFSLNPHYPSWCPPTAPRLPFLVPTLPILVPTHCAETTHPGAHTTHPGAHPLRRDYPSLCPHYPSWCPPGAHTTHPGGSARSCPPQSWYQE